MHDIDGNRLAEYDYSSHTPVLLREYIWMDGEAVGVVENDALYFVRSDYIGRPVFATDGSGSVQWTASYKPFGEVEATTGNPIELRFPGQWFQSESGLHQNWMRDYDPTTGRYLQADPLGLVDGPSVYGYARQNPGRYVDPRGENTLTLCFGGPIACTGGILGAVGIIAMSTLSGDTPKSDKATKARERKAYKTFCQDKPPPTGNRCEDLASERNHAKMCADLRQAHADKWFGGGDSGHRTQIQYWRKRVLNLEERLLDECPELCELLGIE